VKQQLKRRKRRQERERGAQSLPNLRTALPRRQAVSGRGTKREPKRKSIERVERDRNAPSLLKGLPHVEEARNPGIAVPPARKGKSEEI